MMQDLTDLFPSKLQSKTLQNEHLPVLPEKISQNHTIVKYPDDHQVSTPDSTQDHSKIRLSESTVQTFLALQQAGYLFH